MKLEKPINIVHLTDLHGAYFLIDEIGHELMSADLVLISGDITHFGKEKDAKKVIDKINRHNTKILAVTGNCDYPEMSGFLNERKISINRKIAQIHSLLFGGISGSLPCPVQTPFEYSETDATQWLAALKLEIPNAMPLIFISHQPPYNTLNDRLDTGEHVGSKSIRRFIEETKPLICLTGHIHEAIGVDKIESCTIINPGPFRTGKYATIQIVGEKIVDIQLKQITV